MKKTKVKICGLMSVIDAEIMNKYSPDYCGVVFAKGRHFVSDEQAYEIRKALDSKVPLVGVFVNEDIEHICSLVRKDIIQIIQLHGDENSAYIKELKRLFEQEADEKIKNIQIIKAVKISNSKETTKDFDALGDMLLFDTFSSKAQGGTGKRFDINLLPPKINKPFFIAGGVTPENVDEIITQAKPYAVDVSSGVETDGHKDEEKIKKLIQTVRK